MFPLKGKTFVVHQTDDADESFRAAAGHATDQCVGQLLARIGRFADTGKLRFPDQLNNEGDGFYAIKATCGLRAYFWYASSERWVVVISHYQFKDYEKLKPQDKKRMKQNREIWERGRV